MHEDLVADRLQVEKLPRLRIRCRDESAEQVGLLAERFRVLPPSHERVGRPEQLLVLAAVSLELLSPRR